MTPFLMNPYVRITKIFEHFKNHSLDLPLSELGDTKKKQTNGFILSE